ncbi:hypothetical protein V6N11_072347 [Hibiscus sabdariffa]|uniref:Uncharacterized protein n=1 Tax=Hibiscus sabdariffa TaxID=183260 RepID=A0ABR2U313_9ROSI
MTQLGEDVPLEKSDVLKRQRTSFALSTISEKSNLDGRLPFRFEAAWLLEDSCEREVQALWEQSAGSVPDRLRWVSNGLVRWIARIRHERRFSIKALQRKLEALCEEDPTDDILGEVVNAKLALNLEYDRSELYWEQRARKNWLQYGDRNTAFFHRSATERRRKNFISELEDDSGTRICSEEGMHFVARSYFQQLFCSIGACDADVILQGINPCISNSMNDLLVESLCLVMFCMH